MFLVRSLVALIALCGIAQAQVILPFSGTSRGNGGNRLPAHVDPKGLCIQGDDLWVADAGASQVVFISPISNMKLEYGGAWQNAFAGDGQVIGSSAVRFNGPVDVQLSGPDLYISDQFNHRVRKVEGLSGLLSTVAGNGGGTCAGACGDGGQATMAPIPFPTGLCSAGTNFYVVQASPTARLRRIASNGIISTVAGCISGVTTCTAPATGVPAINAQFGGLTDCATDTAGNLYLSEPSNARVWKVGSNGLLTLVAGGPNTPMGSPQFMSVFDNVLYFADATRKKVFKVNLTLPYVLDTVAGNGSAGRTGDGGNPLNATFISPFGVAANAGAIYVSDFGGQNIRYIDTSSSVSTPTNTAIQVATATQTRILKPTACRTLPQTPICE